MKFEKNIKISQKYDNYTISQGGSLYIEFLDHKNNFKLFSLKKSQFSSSLASSGGSIFVNSNDYKKVILLITDNTFKNNAADHGENIRILGQYYIKESTI